MLSLRFCSISNSLLEKIVGEEVPEFSMWKQLDNFVEMLLWSLFLHLNAVQFHSGLHSPMVTSLDSWGRKPSKAEVFGH